MNKLTDWIKRHQIIAFFVITFAITWGLGFSYGGFLKRSQFLLAPLVATATCGPALAGIIISTVTNTQPRQGSRKAFWITFFISWVVSALVFIAHMTLISHLPLSAVLIGVSVIWVVPVAFVVASTHSRIPSVRSYLASLIRLLGVWGWSFLGLALTPALILLSVVFSNFLGGGPITAHLLPDLNLALIGLIAVKFLYQFFFFNATGEEAGWRGFALPRLQSRTSPLIAALIIAVFWVPWHFFLWQAEGNPVLTMQYWLVNYINAALFSVIIVWICNRAKGSILVAGITHAAGDTVGAFIPLQGLGLFLTFLVVALVAALVMILVDRMWKKLPSDHPAVYQGPGFNEKNVELPQQ